MTTALIITTYNRPEYLKRCLESLGALTERPEALIVVDDCSTDTVVKKILKDLPTINTIWGSKCLITKVRNEGIKDSLYNGFNTALYAGFDLAINLDSDAIVKPNFITRLKELKERYPDHIVSGFNCNNPKNPILYDGEDYVLRKHCNGINMCIDKKQYENIVLPALQSQGNWDYNSTHNLPIVISKPSVVEHIGIVSSMGHTVNPDVSCDF